MRLAIARAAHAQSCDVLSRVVAALHLHRSRKSLRDLDAHSL